MSNICIIDDNADQSGTLKKALNFFLKKITDKATIIDQLPFDNPEDYFSFIEQNNVSALILDERLNDQPALNGKPVDYKGNQLVETLRERLKDFPIYMITAHAGDEELLAKENQFEAVINREDITTDENQASLFVSRLFRSSQRFSEANNNELLEFTTLSSKLAQGDSNPETVERLKVLQTVLELPLSGFDDRKTWLDKYEEEITKLSNLKDEINKKLGIS